MGEKKIIENFKEIDLLTIVNTVSPSYESVQNEVRDLQKKFPNKTKHELANAFANRFRKKYTSVGIVSGLPSVIPGIGTVTQIGVEAVTVSGDLALMLRWMASTCYGVGLIYDQDIKNGFDQEFVNVLGIWCGQIKSEEMRTEEIVTKVATIQFKKNISSKMLLTLNKRIGTTIFTKYGTKRGGIVLGKLIPFGIGALVGGSFNYFTMNSFKQKAIEYFQNDENTEYVIYENLE